jgi:DNA-binding PadR family transcriptional regulator
MDKVERKLFVGFVRLHILHHCGKRPWYGQELQEELAEHGYRLSFGTLYPLLHDLEASGLLQSREDLEDGRWRRHYQTTEQGLLALHRGRALVKELMDELEEEDDD